MEEIKKNKCKVCGKDIDIEAFFCPHCKFPQLILPAEVSEDVLKFEEERVSLYKGIMKSVESSSSKSELIGYLIVMQDEDYQQVFPIYKGINIFGEHPRYEEGVFGNKIDLESKSLVNENFSLIIDEKGTVTAKLIDGSWSIGYLDNSLQEKKLSNGDIFIIGDLKFILIKE